MSEGEALTVLLQQAARGEPRAWERLAPHVYRELERVAAAKMRRRFGAEMPALSLEPAELVQETMLKLFERPTTFENRRHFYAYATKVMLGAMIDYERRRRAQRRGGGVVRVSLSVLDRERPQTSVTVLADLLQALEELDPRKAEVVKLRVFWGLKHSEIAATLGVALATVERDWKFSRAWLLTRLGPQSTANGDGS